MSFLLRFISCLFVLSVIAPIAHADDTIELDDVSIVIATCDKYSELWHPATTLLYRQWPTLLTTHKHIPIYLFSNEKSFGDPRVTNLVVGHKDKTWKNLLAGLSQVKTKYIILTLEDYIFTRPVNVARLKEMLDLAKRDNAAFIELDGDAGLSDGPPVPGVEGVTERAKGGAYRLNTQTGIWNREIFMSLIDPEESTWKFETNGSRRSDKLEEPFYLVTKNPVFTYLNAANEGRYIKSAVDYINAQGIPFAPTAMPLRQKCGKLDLFCGVCKKFNILCSLSSGRFIENDRGITPH